MFYIIFVCLFVFYCRTNRQRRNKKTKHNKNYKKKRVRSSLSRIPYLKIIFYVKNIIITNTKVLFLMIFFTFFLFFSGFSLVRVISRLSAQ